MFDLELFISAFLFELEENLNKDKYIFNDVQFYSDEANTANFGVPQTRKRIIIIGTKIDSGLIAKLPDEVLTDNEWITARQAIDELWDEIDTGKYDNHSHKDFSKAKMLEKGQGNKQIGNAVPPVFAWHIAQTVTEILEWRI